MRPPLHDPYAEAATARDAALRCLRVAGRCDNTEERDRLTRRALVILDGSRTARRAWAEAKQQERRSTMSRKLTAEFLGTLWLVLGGCGAAVLAAKFPEVGIGLVGVSLAFGLTVLTMAYAIGHISGCHLNPAVTLGLVAAGRFQAREAPAYIGAQVLGGVAGAAILLLIAGGKAGFDAATGFATNGFGTASPGGYALGAALLTEVVMTFFFLLIILGVTSERAPKGFAPIAIGLGLTLIHLISIPVTNTSVNPARSTGVALFGPDVGFAQLWLFWVAPIAGAVLAGLVHTWLGAEESAADRDAAAAGAAMRLDEALAPATAREPR